MTVLMFPLVNSVLRHFFLGSSQLNLKLLGVGVESMYTEVLETIDKPGTVSLRGLTHESVDDSVLSLNIVYPVIFEEKWVFGNLVEHLVSC
jgi:hypothetical protein